MTAVEVHAPRSGSEPDVVVDLALDVSIGEVLDALALPSDTLVDGAVMASPASTPAHLVLHRGSELRVSAAQGSSASDAGFVEIAVVAGLDAGAVARLGSGLFHVTTVGGLAETAGQNPVRHGWVLQVDDRQIVFGRPKPWHEQDRSIETLIGASGSVLAVGGPVDPEAGQRSTNGGTVTVNRPPRPISAPAPRPIMFQDAPEAVREPSPLSWATLLAPLPIALMMAFFFRPIFALFALMGPVMAVGRWWESRRRFRRDTVGRGQRITQMRSELADRLGEQAETEACRRWANHPHVGALWRRAASGSVRLWQRRPGDPGFMQATVGVGAATASVVKIDKAIPVELSDLLEAPLLLRPVPLVVDLSIDAAVGIVGSRAHAMAVARSLVAQLATAHGPADVRIGVICSPQNARAWDWLKWLPHIDDQWVTHDVGAITAILAPAQPAARHRSPGQPNPGPVRLVIVDAPGADVAAVVRAAHEADVEVRCIALASEPTLLPAVCSTVYRVTGNGLSVEATESSVASATPSPSTPTGVSLPTAESWARSLAKFCDPESADGTAGSQPSTFSFLELVGYRSTDELAHHWAERRADAAPTVALGQGSSGTFELDLTADGPHALIAGTTGSGKSELLRTLVAGLAAECSPEQLNLVLVDFKGGGAFDVVRDLPHVVGLITDLDETLVSRALLSLRAELERRERLFREQGVSTFEQAVAGGTTALARLVIIIDEFAALATDYGELMSGIIDLAARGRSLGMHLVLATQRPSGVVDQKIRANTNIRIALRVQDEFDSQDVVGTADAARIDRRAQGRAIVRVGGDRPVAVQMAFSGGRDTQHQRFSIRPHRLFYESEQTEPSSQTNEHLDDTETEYETELQSLVRTVLEASAQRESSVRPLWAPPLPSHLDWIDLGSRELAGTTSAAGFALGLADIPDQQAQIPWRWDPGLGALGIFGASGSDAGKALVSIGAAMALATTPDALHIYVIDGHAGATCVLESLRHTGAYVRSQETDRVDRVIRMFEAKLVERQASPANGDACMVLLIDNLAAVLAAHDEVEASVLNDRLAALARDGATLGIHLAIAARTPRDITHRLAQQIPNRLIMDLADPNGFLALGLRLRDVGELPPMRAIDARTRHVIQLVEPPDLTSLLSADVSTDRVAPPVKAFPSHQHVDTLEPASIDSSGLVVVPIGVDAVDLGPALLMLRPGEHVLVVGTPGMGRSCAIETIARQLERCSEPVAVVRVSPERPSVDEIEQLTTSTVITAVLVDDADAIAPAAAQALEALMNTNNPWVRIVASARPDSARSLRSWMSPMRSSGTGIVIGGTVADGDIFRVRLGPLAGRGTVPGRASLIDRGRVVGVQLASPNDAK